MIETIEELKTKRHDLVELFEKMTKSELLNQCYLECIDAINMESRVSLFMANCTDNMSRTDYSISALSALITNKKELEIDEFCYYLSTDQSDQSVLKAIKQRASSISKIK